MSPTPTLEEQLMEAVCAQHAAALWSWCLRLTRGDRERAEDLAQETLLRAWRHPDALGRDPDGVRAWLFTVARTLAVDGWRARSLRPETPVEPDRLEPIADVASSDGVDRMLQQWLVVDALRSLSAEHRTAIVECYYGGRTAAEVGERLGVAAGTVKSRLHYGLRALRLALEERGVTR